MRLLPLLVMFLAATSAHNAKSTTTFKSALTSLRESPFSFTYGLVGASERDEDSKIEGWTLYHDFLVSYEVTDKDEVRIMPEFSNNYRSDQFFTYKEEEGEEKVKQKRGGRKDNLLTSYQGVEFRYRRKDVLTEAKHKVSGQFQQRYFYYNNKTKAYGVASTRFYLGRVFTDRLSLNGLAQYDHNHNASDYTGKDRRQRRFLFSATPGWNFTDQLSGGVVFRYQHSQYEKAASSKSLDKFELIPQLSYTLSTIHSLGATAYVPILKSHDGKTLVKDMLDGVSYELSYTLSAF